MYSSVGKSQSGGAATSSSAASLKNYEFDFGLGAGFSGRGGSRPLRDQMNPSPAPNAAPFSSSVPSRSPFSAAASATSAPNKPLWTPQPAPGMTPAAGAHRSTLSNPTSMVGDIFGKSWASAAPASSAGGGLGIPPKDPNLFGDLVGSVFGQAKGGGVGGSNVPLKAAAPRNSYSMGNLSDALPKATSGASNLGNPTPPSRASTGNLGSYYSSAAGSTGRTIGNSMGGQPMKSSGMATGAKKDPFGSLVDFGSKKPSNPPPAANSSFTSNNISGGDYSFGAFQDANLPKMAGADAKMDDFGMPPVQDLPSQKSPPPQPMGTVDPLDMLFSSTATSGTAAAAPAGGPGNQAFDGDDWDLGAEFGSHDSGGTTTELEGLPPPPAGVSSSTAKNKGLENHKQGQFADAIKWFSWAAVLLEKSGDTSAIAEVLTCRASCYKEVGEYKKAIADCSKVLEHDSTNVKVLVQRALLYESSEKYERGAEDLRAVLKIDPGNRLARSTIHRLTQMAG